VLGDDPETSGPKNVESEISSSCGWRDPSAPRTAARNRSLCDIDAVTPLVPLSDDAGKTCCKSAGLSLTIRLSASADFA
jgi:hypothetical protein